MLTKPKSIVPFQIARALAARFARSFGFFRFRPFSRHRKSPSYEIGFLFRVVQAAPLRRLTLVVRPRDSGSGVTCGLRFLRLRVRRAIILDFRAAIWLHERTTILFIRTLFI